MRVDLLVFLELIFIHNTRYTRETPPRDPEKNGLTIVSRSTDSREEIMLTLKEIISLGVNVVSLAHT